MTATRRLLIVSPHFPPVDAVDMHRVRTSLPYYAEFGWNPIVLAVEPEFVERLQEPLLLETLPKGLRVHRVRALSPGWTRKLGFGDLGLRALPYLRGAGSRIIRENKTDLVFFSTTMFPATAAGPGWKHRHRVPYVIDMQDPWVSDYLGSRPRSERPPKYWLADRLHRTLEPWTMRPADGIIATSQDYIDTLQRRYPTLKSRPWATLPFGAAEGDFEVVRTNPQQNPFFRRGDGAIHGVYVGRGGKDMARSLRVIFQAFAEGLREEPGLFSKVRLHFIGTDYASPDRARKTVEPIAVEAGVGNYVTEDPKRVPYFQALQLLLDADFLLVPGSDDLNHSASKVFPYILARRPLLCVVGEGASHGKIVRETSAGELLCLPHEGPVEECVSHLAHIWGRFLRSIPFQPKTDWKRFEAFTAREMTRRQCDLFNRVVGATQEPSLASRSL